MSDAELILVAGAVLALGIAAALLADRVKVPGLILFLGLGMLVGSEGIGGVHFDDAELTRTLGTIGLILILFEGGLAAGWREIRPVLPTAVSLAAAGTVITASVTRSPRNLPASSTSLRRTCAEISSGAYCLPFTSNRAAPSGPGTTSKETALSSLVISSYFRPMNRFAE